MRSPRTAIKSRPLLTATRESPRTATEIQRCEKKQIKKKKNFYCLWEKRNGQQTKEKTGQGGVFALVMVVAVFLKDG